MSFEPNDIESIITKDLSDFVTKNTNNFVEWFNIDKKILLEEPKQWQCLPTKKDQIF